MERFCRGCLVRYDEPEELLRYTEKNRRLFVYCTGLQVKRNDTFTFQLCKDCYLNMKMACNFKKQCRNSDKKFKSFSALKETGESVDLSTYLRNNDDSLAFKFPTFYGNSTPAHEKLVEDDTESTTTSIRNFMTDIMPDTDLPETEARIIREVIEEEADLLDDSLDSHWLQDDASIDTNFRLDFSFSPFSTPRPLSSDRYTPAKLAQNEPVETTEDHEQNCVQTNQILDMPILTEDSYHAIIPVKVQPAMNYDEKIDTLDAVNDILKYDTEIISNVNKGPAEKCLIIKNIEENLKNCDYKVDKIYPLDAVSDILTIGREGLNNTEVQGQQCTIDKNLEMALRNSSNKKTFALDELLASPQVIPGIQTPPTPLINNILFGEKLDMDENSNNTEKDNANQSIVKDENIEDDLEMSNFDIDIKEERMDIEDRETDTVAEELIEQMPVKDKQSDMECMLCDKYFDNLKSLRRHERLHTTILVCHICSKEWNDKANLERHIQTHMPKPQQKLECEACQLTFTSKRTLNMHKRAHNEDKGNSNPTTKRHTCSECAFSTDKASNFKLHWMRHKKIFRFKCSECDKGFVRKLDLTIHMRYHTGEKPFRCKFCDHSFARADGLTRHIKTHLDKPYRCDFCKQQFINSTNLKNHHRKSKRCSKRRDQIADELNKIEENAPHVLVTKPTLKEDCIESCTLPPEEMAYDDYDETETPLYSPSLSDTKDVIEDA